MTTEQPENLGIAAVIEGLNGWTQASKLLDIAVGTLQNWARVGYVCNKHAIPLVVRVAKQNELQTSVEALTKPNSP